MSSVGRGAVGALALALTACGVREGISQPPGPTQSSASEVQDQLAEIEADELRAAILSGDPEGALRLARASDHRTPRLRAWSVCAAAMAGERETARRWSATLLPPEPWAAFASGCIHHVEQSRKSLARTAWGMSALEGHEDMVWLRARALWRNRRSHEVLHLWWDALIADNALTDEARRAQIVPQLEAMERDDAADPGKLYIAAEYYGALGLTESKEAIWQRLERDHPGTEAADRVAWGRIDALDERIALQMRQQGKANPALLAEVADRYRGVLSRPDHEPTHWRGRAYIGLFSTLHRMENVDEQELLEVVEGMVEHDDLNPQVVYAFGARELAEKTSHKERALELVELGFEAAERKLERDLAGRSQEEREKARKYLIGEMYVAKIDVLVHAARLEEATKVLETAEKAIGSDARLMAMRGKIAEKRGKPREAEAIYVEGLALEANALRRPCTDALERLYKETHGSERGMRRHIARLEKRQRAQRKEQVLSTREAEGASLRPFHLDFLDEGSMDSKALLGKVAVVHFWATWCGFCVLELEEILELVRKYDGNPDVEVVLISGDTNREQLLAWMAENGLRFPTLLDTGYAQQAGIRTWPTTLFVDRSGQIRYRHIGATRNLVEEFSWRIDDLHRERGGVQ